MAGTSRPAKRQKLNWDALLALTYPTGFDFHQQKLQKYGFKLEPADKLLQLHGLFEPGAKATDYTYQEIEAVSESDLIEDIQKKMEIPTAFLDKSRRQKLMNHERAKHANKINFLTLKTYPDFVLDLYRLYEFDGLFTFLFRELSKRQIELLEFYYFRTK